MATYANPLHFTLTPLKASLDAEMIYQNAVAATLTLSMRNARAGTSHGPNDHQPLIVSWKSVPLIAQDRSAFMALIAKLLDTPRASFGISGTAGLVGKMVIGNIPIHGIPFNVTTSMAGFNSFTGKATLKRLDVKKGTPQYLDNTGMLVLTNPSNITVHTTGISLPSFYKNTYVGRSIMNNKIIVPGDNLFDTIVRFQPDGHNNSVALEMLTRYAQPQEGHGAVSIPYQTPVVIKGTPNADPPLTPFASLIPGMEKTYVESSVPGIAIRVLNEIDSYFDALTLFSAPGFRPYIYIKLTFRNDFPVPQTFLRIQSDASVVGTSSPIIASFTENHVTNCRIPAASATKVNPGFHKCDKIPNVLIPQGLIASAPSIGKNLNVKNLVQIMVDDNGYVADGFRYNEEDVLTTYALAIGDIVLLNVTTVLDLINGILDALPKLPSTEVSKITDSFSKLGSEGIIQLANTEWKHVVCALENLPLSLIHTADCSTNTAAGKVAASSASASSRSAASTASAASASSAAAASSARARASPQSASSAAGQRSAANRDSGGGSSSLSKHERRRHKADRVDLIITVAVPRHRAGQAVCWATSLANSFPTLCFHHSLVSCTPSSSVRTMWRLVTRHLAHCTRPQMLGRDPDRMWRSIAHWSNLHLARCT